MACIYDEPLEPYICEADWNCKDCPNWVEQGTGRKRGSMTRQEKEDLLREAVDILIKLDNHLMTSRDNAEFSQWVEDLIDNYCEDKE